METAERELCDGVDDIIRAWERTGRLTDSELTLVVEHVGQCRRCARTHGSHIPFLRRDNGKRSGLRETPVELSALFTERLMNRITGEMPARSFTRTRRMHSAARLPLALAANAVLLIGAAFLVWLWGSRPKGNELSAWFAADPRVKAYIGVQAELQEIFSEGRRRRIPP